MQKQVERGQAPKEVDRVDKADPRQPNSKPHIHFGEGQRALNIDGTWADPGTLPIITNKIAEWLLKNGWSLPKE